MVIPTAAQRFPGPRAKARDWIDVPRRAWATVNKETGGGNKSGSGRGRR